MDGAWDQARPIVSLAAIASATAPRGVTKAAMGGGIEFELLKLTSPRTTLLSSAANGSSPPLARGHDLDEAPLYPVRKDSWDAEARLPVCRHEESHADVPGKRPELLVQVSSEEIK